MSIPVSPPQLLEISGPDAVAFAHAQFSSDVRALAVGRWQWSAWLSAQGRVRALFRLLHAAPERLVLALDAASAASLQAALERFVLRAKVQLRVCDCSHGMGYWSADDVRSDFGSVPTETAFVDAGNAFALAIPGPDGIRWLGFGNKPPGAPDLSPEAAQRWRLADIRDGIVALSDAQSDRFLPQWIGLDRLGAVSVSKGCYPGQEIVARLHFKGGNKRWLQQVEFEAQHLPPPGTALAGPGDTPEGELVTAAWTRLPAGMALAILPRHAPGTPLHAAAVPGATFRVVSEVADAAG